MVQSVSAMPGFPQFPAVIPAGQALSGEVDLGDFTLVGIQIPPNFTTAPLSFLGSIDGGSTWSEIWDITNGEIEVASLTGGTLQYFIALDPARFRGVRSIVVRSGTQASPVNQVNAVTLMLCARSVS